MSCTGPALGKALDWNAERRCHPDERFDPDLEAEIRSLHFLDRCGKRSYVDADQRPL